VDRDKYTAVAACIDGYRDEVIRLQTEMCKRPALGPESGGEGEVEKAAWLESYLRGLGFSVDRYDAPDARVPCGFRPNLVAVLPGEVAAPRLWLLAHTDVVPPGDMGLWTGDPWVVRVEGDRLIGRGAEDNQAGLVSALLTLKAFREAGLAPRVSIGVALVADEETANTYGLKFLLREHKHLFGKDDWIIVPDSGNPKGTAVEVAEKSILWLRFRVRGKQAHGSEPNRGINAHKAAAHLTTRLDTLYARFRKRDAVFEPPMSTFEPTKREANVPNVNTIPGEDVFYFDCRVLPDYRLADVLSAVRALVRETEKKFRVKVEMTTPQKEEAAPPTASDAPVARAVARAVRELRRRSAKAIGIGGGTVAKYLREAGFPCVVWSTMDERAHTPDEYAVVSYILDDAKVFAHVALQGAGS